MNRRTTLRLLLLAGLFAGGFMLLFAGGRALPPESVARQRAIQALGPGGAGDAERETDATGVSSTSDQVSPVSVNLADIPPHVYDPNNQLDRWLRGEIDLDENEGLLSEAEQSRLRQESQRLPSSEQVQSADGPGAGAPLVQAPAPTVSFAALDYTECCGGGGSVPPDPELAVGPNHIIAVVNVAFEIYNKSGSSVASPRTFSSFMGVSPDCTGLFDPNVLYDESADRFILGADAAGDYYCAAVSQSSDPTGSWFVYAFPTDQGSSDFFDYPHAGVGRDALYMGGNIFDEISRSFTESRVWAFNKAAMYAGQSTAFVSHSLPVSEDTPQPLHLHGWDQGTWPSTGSHAFFTTTSYNGADYSMHTWADPFGANLFSTVRTVNLSTYTGVSAGLPLPVPQLGGNNLQANDFRPQDFEYRNGYGWSTQTIACNPGGGTVNCVRWAQIDLSNGRVVDGGVYGSDGVYRFFGDLAVNHCNDMAIGYSKSSSSTYPAVWYTGRRQGEAPGTLQAERQLKAGELTYTAFDSAPHRWGDYTGMTIDPDGIRFWYLGQYSKNTGTTSGRWGTYVGSFSYPCPDDPPSVAIVSPSAGSTVTGTITVQIAADDDHDSPESLAVAWRIDGGSWQTASYNGNIGYYEASWDTKGQANGQRVLEARATDSAANQTTDSVTVSVVNVNEPPVAQFSYACSGLSCTFDGSASSDGDGTIFAYRWEFGDGSGPDTTSGVTATHDYAESGTYTVTLTVTDNQDAEASTVASVDVSEAITHRVFVPLLTVGP